eukprot:CAMPEP_0117048582 /NCGR_PEP_ID=MMETSP0472-20121206/33581_1 /TAXON_ID=693140 ORGANISM="Tiarina fusus, Strain LIS" /NCGR_SAMPLE_ID=MMETSP0472 /ASSEMBLY_ACC=CAM_ASM_000603 /LENGTH=95 /DNA_ID=CAMNT_0004761733 /DNA_START=422 /DNA_END=709 /DNA_ORIENTATION=-
MREEEIKRDEERAKKREAEKLEKENLPSENSESETRSSALTSEESTSESQNEPDVPDEQVAIDFNELLANNQNPAELEDLMIMEAIRLSLMGNEN